MIGETVAAISTPPGQGGIAVVRISGPQSYDVAQKIVQPKNTEKIVKNRPGYSALLADFVWKKQNIDMGVALFFRAPHSYTGEDVVELSCHGGSAVTQMLLQACIEAGAAPAEAGEFTKRAFLNGKLSITQAEAVMELVAAGSRQGAAVAKAAQSGALHMAIMQQKEKLVQLAGHLAAWVDYPEEDVPQLEEEHFVAVVNDVCKHLENLADGYEKGRIARQGLRCAIVGSPNVGKSTLFNLLSGFESAIVTPVAGTTRDVVREQIHIGGIALHLADTAGLHTTNDPVEKEGIRRSHKEIDQAQLIIAVFDASRPLTAPQLEFAQGFKGRPALAFINKTDLGMQWQAQQLASYFQQVVEGSALQPESQQPLEQAVLTIIGMNSFDPNAATLVNQRQLAAATQAIDALHHAAEALHLSPDAAGVCLDDALRALAMLTGEDISEAIVEEVFSKFCVGK